MTAPLLGAGFGLGLLLLAAGLHGGRPSPRRSSSRASAGRGGAAPGRGPAFAVSAAAFVLAGTLVFLLTGWTAGAALAGLAVVVLPKSLGDTAAPKDAVRRAEAVATWAEMLRDTMAAAAGIEEAIMSTAPVAPLAIRPEVRRLAARLERERLRPALSGFADELSDPTADLVVTALLLAADHHARDLGALLGALASCARAEAAMVLRVEAGRSRLRTAARVVTLTTLGFALLLVLFNRDFLAPYDDALGQAWLLVVGALFALGVRELGRMSRITAAPRLLAVEAP